MTAEDKISLQLDQIIKSLDKLTKPGKIALNNFIAGIFHSLGSLFGTIVIASIILYLLSSLNFPKLFSGFIESTMNQIDWSKILPSSKNLYQ